MFSDTFNLGALVAIGTIIFSVFGLGWKIRDWIGHLQEKFESGLDRIKEALDKHELKDTERFYDIHIRLARLGNGSAPTPIVIKQEEP